MKRLLLPLAALTIAGLLLYPVARPASACTCAVLATSEHVKNADQIAIGIIVSLVDSTEQFPPIEGKTDGIIPDVDAVVEAERYLKGTGPAEFEVDDPPSGGTCGFLDQSSVGKRYLLFLTGDASPLETHLCSGSTLLSDDPAAQQRLQDVEAITGPGTLPTGGSEPPVAEPSSGVDWLPIIIASALGGGVLTATLLLLRSRLSQR